MMEGIGVLAVLILSVTSVYAVNSCPGPESWSDTVFLLHEDCQKFYKCVFGRPIEMSCGAGLYFNLETSRCDWKANVDCPNDESDEEHGSQFLENGCPRDSSLHWLLPHENDCNLFYSCISGRKLQRSCPGSLHFDFKQQTCGWPKPNGCTTSNEDSSTEIDSNENNPSKEDNSIEDDTKEDISKEDNSKEDNSKEDNSKEDISKEDDSEEDISKENNTDEDVSKEDSSSEGSSENNSSEDDITIEEFSEEDTSKENDTKENSTEEEPSKEDDSDINDSNDDTEEDTSKENDTSENVSKESISNEDDSNEDDSATDDTSEENAEGEDTSNDTENLRGIKIIEAIVDVDVLKNIKKRL